MTEQEIRELYNTWQTEHGDEPRYANCQILFKGEENSFEDIIKLYSSTDGKSEDDHIFYYCDGIEDLIRLMEDDNGEDFIVINVIAFTNNLD